MSDFMDQDVVDEMLEANGAARPFVEDRTALKGDAVGQVARLIDAFLADRQTVVETGQVERVVDSHVGEQSVVGELLDRQDDVGEMCRERFGQRREAGAGDRFNLVGVRR